MATAALLGSNLQDGSGNFPVERSRLSERGMTTTSGLRFVDNEYGSILGYDVNDRFTEGVAEVWLDGKTPITLIGIRQRFTKDNILEPLGAFVAMPDRPYAFAQELPYFPPRATPDLPTVRKLEGIVLRPGSGASTMGFELLLGYRVTGTGRAERPGIDLDYEVAGTPYTVHLPDHITVCVPKRDDCPAPF